MAIRIPPLPALRVFEMASRHPTFALAAEEIGITPSAVSHQVRQLERHLGANLFERGPRGSTLTPAGIIMARAVDAAYRRIAQGIDEVGALAPRNRLRISCVPAYATILLAPHMHEFERANPDLDIRLEVTSTLADLASDGIDCGIRYGGGRWPDLKAWRLANSEMIAVASPRLVAELGLAEHPERITDAPLIDLAERPDAWRMWFGAVMPGQPVPRRKLRIESLVAGLQAAETGVGIVLAPSGLAEPLIAAGRLATAHPGRTSEASDYFLVCRKRDAESAKVRRFRTWLLEAMGE
jgi:LysR family transcriptional regulator, glycine cleavage system transcriptional activator